MTLVASKPAASWPWLKSYPAGIDWRTEFKPRPLYRLLDDAAARFGDKPCIDFMDRRWSFSDIKALYSNRQVQIGTDDQRRPLYESLGSYWLGHANRRAANRWSNGCVDFQARPGRRRTDRRLLRRHPI